MKTATFPFVMLPNVTLWQKIGSHAKCLFAALLSRRNRKTGLCNPALKTLAGQLGTSLSTMRRALAELRRAGMVLIQRTLFGNRYELTTPDQWGTTISVTECALTGERSAALTDERTQRSRVSAQEPDVLNHIEDEPDAAADGVHTLPEEAAAAATAFVEIEPENPTPPAPGGGSPGEPAASGHMAETENGNFPKNFPGEFFPAREAAAALVAELMPVHPEPGNLPKAISEVEKLVASRPGGVPATIEAIRASHASWRARWAEYGAGRFIPQLWRWIHDGDWLNIPADRKGVRSETWIERRAREQEESDEKSYRTYAELGAWDILREYMGPEEVEVWRARIEAETAA